MTASAPAGVAAHGHIGIERHGGVLAIRFRRPEKKNAITGDMYGAVARALTSGEANPDVRAYVLFGSGGTFTAGNDIADFQATGSLATGAANIVHFLTLVAGLEKPLIAGVDGLAVGVGTTLLMHCDMVYATPAAWFQTPFTALGLVPEAGSSLIGPRLLGHAVAFELLVAGRRLTAERALAAGLINAICAPEALEAETLKLAAEIAALPPEAVKLSKRLLKGDGAEVAARIRHEVDIFAERLKTPEAQAAFAAFFAGR